MRLRGRVLLAGVALLSVAIVPGNPAAVAAESSESGSWAASRSFLGIVGGPNALALQAGLAAYQRALRQGLVSNPDVLTIIDYTLPSVDRRLWVLDMRAGAVLYRELVAHGRGSGGNLATSFGNTPETYKSSLGLFVTESPYTGQNGYSLRLEGLEHGINDNAWSRAIVIHGAPYVNPKIASHFGRLGRSLGCPAVRPTVARSLIDTIKGGSVVYAYGPRDQRTHR